MAHPINQLILSPLPKTWILDLDGTILVHNGHLSGKDKFLPGSLEFLKSIPLSDMIIIITSRDECFRASTETILKESGIKNFIMLMGVPVGERILINDLKESGLKTAYAINVERNKGIDLEVSIDRGL